MERESEVGVGGSRGRTSGGGGGSGGGGAETAAMPDLAIRGIGDGRHADERDAVDRLPAGNGVPAGRGRRPEVNDRA